MVSFINEIDTDHLSRGPDLFLLFLLFSATATADPEPPR
jgi:hypothetical protein